MRFTSSSVNLYLDLLSRIAAITATAIVSILIAITMSFASPVNVDANGLALQGYDPVAYFTDGKPVKGSPDFTAEYDGATYHFASAEHQSSFTADPAKFAPQYGGYCAYGLSLGSKAPVEVDKFSIVDGKLYLNFNGDIQSRWTKDVPGYVAKADENWTNIE
ncbi:MAG: YHS domain-containing (seleno)protein [Salaquimonas sp.]